MTEVRQHPRVQIVSDGTELGRANRFPLGEPGEQAFRAGVTVTNALYESACLIADAFLLACSRPYLDQAFAEVMPKGWTGLVIQMVEGLAKDLMWVVTGAGIGAAFGAGLGLLLPPAEPLTLAGGAALGASITMWALIGIGIIGAVKLAYTLSSAVATLFGEAVRLALAHDQERSARLFARGLALTVGVAAPLAVLVVLTKGGGRLMKSQATRFMLNNLSAKVGASQLITAAHARSVGLMSAELEAIAQATRGLIKVFRGCNPARVEAIERNGGLANVHFKPGYFKDFKSSKTDLAGEYVVDMAEMQHYIKGHYSIERIGTKLRLRSKQLGDTNAKDPYLDRTSPVEGGPWLDGHWLEPVMVSGKAHYKVRHPDGKAFVPDIDRLMYAEIGETGRLGKSGVLSGKNWLVNDDPREVMHWNDMISRALTRIMGRPLDWRGFQHGKSWDYQKAHKVTGEVGPAWPARDATGTYLIDNETIVIGIDGRLFATDWNGLATFMKSIEILGIKYPWAKAIIK